MQAWVADKRQDACRVLGAAMRVTAKQRFKAVTCTECGADLQVGSNTRLPVRCTECGVRASEENARQMQGKSGIYYERWMAGCYAAAEKAIRGARGG